MSEDYWNRRRRQLNEDHKFRREQSKRDIRTLKTIYDIDRLTDEIIRRERSERLNTLLDRMHKEKAFALDRISACSDTLKDRWYQCLDGIDVTRSCADSELKNLREAVERARKLWSAFELPEWWKNLLGEHNAQSTAPESTEKRRPSPFLNPLELKWEQEQKDRELERKLEESELALILSSLDLLISYRNEYEARSNL